MLMQFMEKYIVYAFIAQLLFCAVLFIKQMPPKNQHHFARNQSDNHLYVFHDELLPDDSAVVLDEDDQEGVVRLGPTESPAVQQMRIRLNNLNYAQVPPNEPDLVKVIREFWLRWPSKKPYKLNSPEIEDFSMGQSAVVDSLLKQKVGGFFVECGALDGEIRSNTLFFERKRNWTGLLIEAGPINYRQMTRKNRKAYISPACLGVHPYPAVVSFNRGRNRGRVINRDEAFDWIKQNGLHLNQMESQCFPLYSYLLALNRTSVDYLSLDVEGVELEVLKTIPFDKVDIRVMSVEFSHGALGKEVLRQFVESKGYRTVTEVTHAGNLANDFIFMKS